MRKYTIEYIKNVFEKENYNILSDEYIGCKQKLVYVCPVGHTHSISFSKWLAGQRCYYCNGNVKLNTSYVRNRLNKEGYILLSEYINSASKFKFRCPNKHVGYMKWDHWRDGHRCSKCAGNSKINKVDVESFLNDVGYTLVDIVYINGENRIYYVCDKGHEGCTTWSNFKLGIRCAECSGVAKKTIEFIKDQVEKEGYTLITDKYNNCHQKLHVVCSNGHDYFVSWSNWYSSGSRCVKCNMWGTSLQEQTVVDFLKSSGVSIIERDRSIIYPYELDIVIPDKKLAIEYCGLYWHSEAAGKNKNYHLNKLNLCNRAGYRLITIFEDELVYYKDVVFAMLANILELDVGVNIQVDECVVKEITNYQSEEFCNTNHMPGHCVDSDVRLGLFSNDVLVSVMLFKKDIAVENNVWKLTGFCSKVGVSVVGGDYKLLKYFEKKYTWDKIFVYVDRRWFDEIDYTSMGFVVDDYIKPTCWYLDRYKRIKEIKKDLKDQTDNVMYNSIWDCGYFKVVKARSGSLITPYNVRC